jgi:glycosyltransferase involved in cell wall biosynthesis
MGQPDVEPIAPMIVAEHMIRQSRIRVSVVIPVRNEAANLPHVLPAIPNWVYELILVDYQSTDGTEAVARALWPGVRFAQSRYGRGKGAALRTGFDMATGDIIVALDGDGSTRPQEIAAFVVALLRGAEYAKGSRFLKGGGTSDMTRFRQLGNWGFVMLVRTLYGGQYTDLCYGYNAFWTWVSPLLELDSNGFEVETVMNIRALKRKLVIAEVPSWEAQRIHGTSNLHAIGDGWRILNTIFQERIRALRVPAVSALAHSRARVTGYMSDNDYETRPMASPLVDPLQMEKK